MIPGGGTLPEFFYFWRMMKRIFCLAAAFLLLRSALLASDTLYVHNPQIPVLIDRLDNVMFQIRVPDARRGDVLESLTVEFDAVTDLGSIAEMRLFYSGTDAVRREGVNFSPVQYISSHNVWNTRSANPSYSVLQEQTSKIGRKVILHSRQQMVEGLNYYWVSVRMDSKASLLTQLRAKVAEVVVNGSKIPFADDSGEVVRRVGYGVRHAGDDHSAAFRIPGLVTTKSGSLIGVYDIRWNSSVDLQERIDIGVSRSADKGQTWDPMRIAMSFGETNGLPSGQNGVGDPAVLVDENTGTIWIAAVWTQGMGNGRAWTNSMSGMEPMETPQLMLVRSDDDGKTWSAPVNVTKQVKDPSWCFLLQGPGRGITMSDGTLVFAIQFIDNERMPHAGIMYSKDRGVTWHIHNPARPNTTEAQVAEVSPGVLMLNMRDNRGGSRAVMTTADLGRTWTEHVSNRTALREPVCMASLISVPADKNSLGKDILLFSNPDTTDGRYNITIKASLDGGVTWPYRLLLDEGVGWGYSCLTMIDPGTVGILYESSVSHITFQAVKLNEIVR